MKTNRSQITVGHQMVGGILGMMDDPALFYRSEVGGQHEYSNWTEEGRAALAEFVLEYSRKLLTAQDKDLESRAREMTWTALKEKVE